MRVRIHKPWQHDPAFRVDGVGILRYLRLDLIPGSDSLYLPVSHPERPILDDTEVIESRTYPRNRRAGERDELFAVNDDEIARHGWEPRKGEWAHRRLRELALSC